MEKVYKATYKTDWIYAEGYVVVRSNNILEGVFALDYMRIEKKDNNSIIHLEALSYCVENKLLITIADSYEFIATYQDFYPFNNYIFFNSSNYSLSLGIEEEILDEEHIKHILLDLKQVRI